MKEQWRKHLPYIIAVAVIIFAAGPLLWKAGLYQFARSTLDGGLDLGLALGFLFAGGVTILGKLSPGEQDRAPTLLDGLVYLSIALFRLLDLFVLTPPFSFLLLPAALAVAAYTLKPKTHR